MRRWLPLVLAFVVTVPALPTGFLFDDWVQRGVVRGQVGHTTKWALFNFGAGDASALRPFIERGPFPWFTLPELKLRFLRPLSSALIVFDTEAFGDTAWPQHLHSSLWHVALVAFGLALYRRLFGAASSLAVLAGVLLALEDSHAMPTAWLANRNALVATTCVLAGLWAHWRWREEGWRPGLALSMLGFALGLSAGETGVAALAFVPALELVPRRRPVKEHLVGLAPAALVLGGYAVLYKALDSGALGSATYVDPLTEPGLFLSQAPQRFLANVGAQALALPDLWLGLPSARPLLFASGVVGLGLFALAWRRWAPAEPVARGRVAALGVGALLAILPTLATFPAARLLTGASFGLAGLVAVLLQGAWRDVGLRRALGVGWLGLAFVLQPLTQWVIMPVSFDVMSRVTSQAVLGLEVKPEERVVVLSSTEFVTAIYGLLVLAEHRRPLPRTWQVVSMAPLATVVTRTGERAFELEVEQGAMIDSTFEENFRSDAFPFHVGDRVPLEAMEVTVLALEKGKPSRVRVALELEPEAFAFVWWNGDAMERVSLPAVGASRRFPRAQTMFERLLQGRREP